MCPEIFDKDYFDDARYWLAKFLVPQYDHSHLGKPFAVKILDNERYAMLHPLMYHNTIQTGHLFDGINMGLDRYCYPDHSSGIQEFEAWDGNSRLEGWVKHHPTGTYVLCQPDMLTSVQGAPCEPEDAMKFVDEWREAAGKAASELFGSDHARIRRDAVRSRIQAERLEEASLASVKL